MSGIAGVVGPPGRNVDPDLAKDMAGALARLGPDRQDRWTEGPVLLAHSLLATTFEETRDAQPLSFEGVVCLVADARIEYRGNGYIDESQTMGWFSRGLMSILPF